MREKNLICLEQNQLILARNRSEYWAAKSYVLEKYGFSESFLLQAFIHLASTIIFLVVHFAHSFTYYIFCYVSPLLITKQLAYSYFSEKVPIPTESHVGHASRWTTQKYLQIKSTLDTKY